MVLTKTNDNRHGHMIERIMEQIRVRASGDKTLTSRLSGCSYSLMYLTTFMKVRNYFKVTYFKKKSAY